MPENPAARTATVAAPTAFQTRAGAYALIVADGRILLSAWGGPEGPVWTLPGGGLELDESCEQACEREVWEETGHTVRLGELLGVNTGHIPAARRRRGEAVPLLTVQVIYRAEVTGGTLRPETDGSSVDAAWFDLAELPGLRTSSWVDRALQLGGHV